MRDPKVKNLFRHKEKVKIYLAEESLLEHSLE